MGAPKGNKYAIGNQGGCPATWLPDLVAEISNRLISWANQDTSLIFPQFCIQEKLTMRQFYYLKESHQEFAEAFSFAKAILACRLIQRTGKEKVMHPALSLRYIKYYDEFLNEFERSERMPENRQTQIKSERYAELELIEPYKSKYEENIQKKL